MATKIKKFSSELRASIFKKIGYSIEYQDLEVDDDGDEIEDSEEGYYWVDTCGNGTYDLFESEDEAIESCLNDIDIEQESAGIKLTKAEKKYLWEEYNIDA